MRLYKKSNGRVDRYVYALILGAILSVSVIGAIAYASIGSQVVSPATNPSVLYCVGLIHNVSVTMAPPRNGGVGNLTLALPDFDQCVVDIQFSEQNAPPNQVLTFTGVSVVAGYATVTVHYSCSLTYLFQISDQGSSATASTVFC